MTTTARYRAAGFWIKGPPPDDWKHYLCVWHMAGYNPLYGVIQKREEGKWYFTENSFMDTEPSYHSELFRTPEGEEDK